TKEEAERLVRDYERRIRSGESLAAIEKEIRAAKDRGLVFSRRVIYKRGNDQLVFDQACPVSDGAWAPVKETMSEFHLVRRERLRPAPKFDEVKDLIVER